MYCRKTLIALAMYLFCENIPSSRPKSDLDRSLLFIFKSTPGLFSAFAEDFRKGIEVLLRLC